jgi:hypothetical protein
MPLICPTRQVAFSSGAFEWRGRQLLCMGLFSIFLGARTFEGEFSKVTRSFCRQRHGAIRVPAGGAVTSLQGRAQVPPVSHETGSFSVM